MSEHAQYEEVNDRLKEIVEAVSDETLPLDDALDLFEEAVKLGMEASTMMEQDMAERDAQAEADDKAADAAFEAALSDDAVTEAATEDAAVADAATGAEDAADSTTNVEDTIVVDVEFDGETEIVGEGE